MTIGYLTRAVHFSASHRYYRPDWSEEENRRRFGEAALPEGHGHNYRCEVTVCGPIADGMVMELPELDRLLESEIVSRFHNRHINTAAREFAPGRALPTTENLAAYILEKIGPHLPEGVRLHRVRVQEDRDLWSDVYGPD